MRYISKTLKNIALFVFLAGTSLSYAAEIKKIGYKNGLSNDHVTSIAQDNNGFLWFATEWGLNRFDGYTLKAYKSNTGNNGSISGNGLNRLLADDEKNVLWIGMKDFGLSRYDCATEKFYNYPINEDLPNATKTGGITDLCFSHDGGLWIATYDAGIKKLDRETDVITHISNPEAPKMHIWSIADNRKGELYIGRVDEGFSIMSLKDYSIRTIVHDPADANTIPSNDIYKVFIDSKQNVWLGTTKGLALFLPETEDFITFRYNKSNPHSLSDNDIRSIREINGELWIGTVNEGVNIMSLDQDFHSGAEKVSFRHIRSGKMVSKLSSDYISDIFHDSFGNIWLGTFGGGVNFISHIPPFFNQIQYTSLKEDLNALSHQCVSAVCSDDRNRIWVGTDGGGIDVYKNGRKLCNYNSAGNTLPSDNLLCALCDSRGNIWFGSYSCGLLLYNEGRNRFERYDIGRTAERYNQIWSIFEDSDNNLWVGSNDGVLIIDLKTGKTKELSGKDIALPNKLIRSICEDNNKNIWIASLIDGVSIVSPGHELIYNLPVIRISHIYNDSKGRIWLASQEGALLFEAPDNYDYKIISQTDGLSDEWIKSVIEGAKDEMWLSTNSGISRYFAGTGRIENYNYHDGAPLASFRGGVVDKDKNGVIYFGSQDGVCYFNSKMQYGNIKVPQTKITGFNVYDTERIQTNVAYSMPVRKRMKLEYNQNTFSIDFNLPDYALKDHVEYVYSLQGLDNLWYKTNGLNQVTFRNLPHGKYTFQVRSRIRNHAWSEDVASVQIDIAPPFWLSWWAQIIYVVLTLIIISVIIIYYFEKRDRKKEQELNNEKLRFYTNVAHELKTPLTLIIGPLADLMADKDIKTEHSKKISLIHKSATRLLGLINQIMEFRKSETHNRKLCVQYGDISMLIQEVVLKYKELNQNEDLSISVSIETLRTQIYYDQEIITIILDNLISNAIKYTPKGAIGIFLRDVNKKGKNYTEIEVRDTGQGMPDNVLDKIFNRYYQVRGDQQASGSGIGLALVKNMVQLHEASIDVKSKLKEGTSFYILLETDNTYTDAEHKTDDEPPRTEKRITASLPVMLVVEDHDEIREYIAESFSGSFEILEAKDGKTGVELAIENIPDIIISDIMMPVMDGFNLCRILKEDMRTSHIPVILLTAKDSVLDKIEGYSIGADSYITKPFNATLLKSRVSNLLEAREKIAGFFSTDTYKSIIATNALSELDNQFIEKTISLIEENITSEQISVTFLAEQLCMSYSSFSRKVKALTGMTSNELIRKIKMQHAEQMLLSRKHTVTEIAYQLGFNNMSHFRQYFKDEFGVIPSKYLKELENRKDPKQHT